MTNIVILGAGKPSSDSTISPLVLINSELRILDCIIDAYSNMSHPRFQFVGGYQFEKIITAYPNLPFVLNNEWRESGSLTSFLLADIDSSSECFVTYSDVIYSGSVVNSMSERMADVVLCCDSNWRSRFVQRSAQDLQYAEKVIFEKGKFKEITIESEDADDTSEFCGVIKFSPKALSFLKKKSKFLQNRFKSSPLFHAINFLSENAFSIDVLDIKNEWAELNQVADLGQYILGTKAQTLTRLRPLVKKGLVGDCRYFSFKVWTESPSDIIEKIQSFSGGKQLIVRSSALSEDQVTQSNAGKYESILNVNSLEGDELESSINKVFGSYKDTQDDDQVLIQVMISDVKLSGVVMTRTLDFGAPYYVINYDVSSFTDAVTSGRKAELQTVLVSRNYNYEVSKCDPFVKSILEAISEIETLLYEDSLDIEFAITQDNKVHIFQVRPVVAKAGFRVINDSKVFDVISSIKKKIEQLQPPPPNILGSRTAFGRMPDWNPAEIIGAKPNELARSLHEFLILDDIWAQQRAEYGYRDVRPMGLLRNFFGHVFVDVRASFNSFIPKNLSDSLALRLVEYYLDQLESQPDSHDKVEFDILYTCYDFDLRERLNSLSESDKFTIDEINLLYTQLVEITKIQFPSSSSYLSIIDGLHGKIIDISESKVPALEKVKLLLHHAKESGTLPFCHLARNGFVATSLLRSLVRQDVITNADVDRFYKSLSTITHKMELDGYLLSVNKISKEEYLSKYGHLRPGTYEISVPTYSQNFKEYFSNFDSEEIRKPEELAGKGWNSNNIINISKALKNSPLPWSFVEFDLFLREAIAGREYAKLQFSKSLSMSLDLIQSWGEEYGLSLSELSHLNINEIMKNGSNVTFMAGFENYKNRITEEKEKKEIAKLLEFPNLIFNSAQLEFHFRHQDAPNFVTAKDFTADLVIVTGEDLTGDNFNGAIILIEQADPGYDWLFSKNIGGLITKYGGSNSHMTIRCSELGIPAAIGVGDILFRKLSLARKVKLDCYSQKIEILT